MLVLADLKSQLDALKSKFDECILNGNSFEEVKKVYLQIKDLEKAILYQRQQLNISEGDSP